MKPIRITRAAWEKLSLIRFLARRIGIYAPRYLWLRLIDTLLLIATPLAVSILPALILDELIAHVNLHRLILYAVLAVGISGATALIKYVLKRYLDENAFIIDQRIEQSIGEALIEMDFTHLEDPRVQDMCQMARDTTNHASSLESTAAECFSIAGSCAALGGMAIILARLLLTDQSVANAAGAVGWLAQNGALCLAFALALCVLASGTNAILTKVYYRYDGQFARMGRSYQYYGKIARDEVYAKDVRVYRLSALIERRMAKYAGENERLMKEVNQYENLMSVARDALMALELIVVYATIGCKALVGVITVGEFYLYASSVIQVISIVKAIAEAIGSVNRSLTYQKSYRDIMKLAEQSRLDQAELPRVSPRNQIVFEHVSFTYPGAESQALRDASFILNDEEKLAIVGRNGAGKTTIVKLLLRLYVPDSGRILWNGQDIQTLKHAEYMAAFSVVFQDFKLMAASLAQNVSMSDRANEADVAKCLRDVGLDELTRKLKNGIHTQVLRVFDEDSVNLSGGEAQKTAIARALYKRAPVFIMDEPTASLDPIAEKEIFEIVADKLCERTAIFISHRLACCTLCDRILVVDGGRIMQHGSHQQLLSMDGLYRELWNAQAGLYTERADS